MVSLQRPASRDYQTMKNWFAFREPITRREARYIRKKEDIVTLRTGRESAGFDGFVERCLTRLDCWLKACGSNMIQASITEPRDRWRPTDSEAAYLSDPGVAEQDGGREG